MFGLRFEEAVFGIEKELELNLKDTCKTCNGSGAKPGTSPETCHRCGGRGQVVTQSKTPLALLEMRRFVLIVVVLARRLRRNVQTAMEVAILQAERKYKCPFRQVLIMGRVCESVIKGNQV